MDALRKFIAQTDWLQIATAWGLRIAGALALLLLGLWLARRLLHLIDRAFARLGFDTILSNFLHNLAYGALLVVVLVAALDQLGVPTTSLLALLGAAGLAIGLALKDSLSNIASGVMLIALRPFRAGDVVNIAGIDGVVEQVRVFQTLLRTIENHEVVLPNSQITSVPIINFTARAQRRIDVPVGISYDADVRHARKVLLDLANAHDKVLAEPAADVIVMALGDNSVDLILRAWVATEDYGPARSDLLEATHRELGAAGIGIPYPQRDVNIRLPAGFAITAAPTPPSSSG
ncbi:MAG: mechanosensitive ion channel protein MscS [Lysobacterales bacterium CG17_big_fil_post_rev_8_21_14_2_50_64_11]|nr:MAG: mechanosensitive ion channel protein MscS [Xanthomonadales bacterium CG17_big_fil_post_rev_8_21_14_2_50_64_11]PIX59622.1 MAG: mechanosensitive ion channel protein MscS [Xanthomonadales bacterium CG_4_10_14_3_um_filter_64_11]